MYVYEYITMLVITSQPLYNTIVGVQANFCVSYPNHAILKVPVNCIVI